MSIFVKMAKFANSSPDLRKAYMNTVAPARKWANSILAKDGAVGSRIGRASSYMADRIQDTVNAAGNASMRSYAYGGGGGMLTGGALGGAYGFATGQEGGFTSGAFMGAAMGLTGTAFARHTPPALAQKIDGIGAFSGFKGTMQKGYDFALTKPLRATAAVAGIGWAGTAIGTTPVNRLRRV